MERLILLSDRMRSATVHLQKLTASDTWVTIQYPMPYAFLRGLPVGFLYIINSPPGLGRSSIIDTLSSIHDHLIEQEFQIWLSSPNFFYLKDSLILRFDLKVKNLQNPLDLPTEVKIGVNRFLTRYGKLLKLSEEAVEKVRERLAIKPWKLAIPVFMVQANPLSCMFN